jgi:CubicO group peptidase (beta-lactamase class C family)
MIPTPRISSKLLVSLGERIYIQTTRDVMPPASGKDVASEVYRGGGFNVRGAQMARRFLGTSRVIFGASIVALMISQGCTRQASRSDEAFIDSIMTANYPAYEPGGVILVAKNGRAFFRRAYGMANVELSVSNQTGFVFSIGSMSKQFTAVCVLQLAQEGRLSLQSDIRAYLPWYDTHGRLITIEQLLTHTSGILSFTEKKDFLKIRTLDRSADEIARFFMDDSLLFEPGSDWSYSNSGYFLLGLIVEKVSGLPLGSYLQKNIFDRLGMSNTHVGTHETVIPRQVTGYQPAGESKYRDASYLSWTWTYGAGEIVSTVDDMLKWDEALYGDRLVGRGWLEKAWRSGILPDGRETHYGYGWARGSYKGVEVIRHGGAINGFVSDGIRIPAQHVYVVALTNNSGRSPSDFTAEIALRVAGVPLAPRKAIKVSTSAIEEYTGVYEVQRIGGRYSTNATQEKLYRYVTSRNDSLFSQRSGGTKAPLLNVEEDLFVFGTSRTYARFERDNRNVIIALEVYTEPVNYGPYDRELKTALPLPKEKVSTTVDPQLLARYSGTYRFEGGFSIVVTTEKSHLYVRPTGQAVEEVFAETATKFFFVSVDASIEFELDKTGKVTQMILNQAGKYEGKKVD